MGLGPQAPSVAEILATYLDRGGNFIDTANGYTNGHPRRSSAITSAATARATAS